MSTIHTVDAIEAITRLKKLGISAYDVGSVLATCIAQRLIRRLCDKCGKRFTTFERVDTVPLIVVKKDGTREVIEKNGHCPSIQIDGQDVPYAICTL